jgi:hypothetical protein
VHRSTGSPTHELAIPFWDPAQSWAFSHDDGDPPHNTYEGVFGPIENLDITSTDHQLNQREREVIIGRHHWSEATYEPERHSCDYGPDQIAADYVSLDASTTDPALPKTEQKTIPLSLAAGNRLVVDPGTPVTLDNGDPGTAYVWVPEEAPWIRVDFTVDAQNRLRGGTVHDTARQKVNERLTLTPTDRTVTDPSDQPVIGKAQ